MESDRKKSVIFGWITFTIWASIFLFYIMGFHEVVQNVYMWTYMGLVGISFLCALFFRIRYKRLLRKGSKKQVAEKVMEFIFGFQIVGMIVWILTKIFT